MFFPAAGTRRLPHPCGGKDNIGLFAQYISGLGCVEDDIVECFRKGGGVPYSKFPRFHEVMEEDSGQELLSALRSIELIRMKDTFNPRLEGRSGRCDEHFLHADSGQRERTTHGHG